MLEKWEGKLIFCSLLEIWKLVKMSHFGRFFLFEPKIHNLTGFWLFFDFSGGNKSAQNKRTIISENSHKIIYFVNFWKQCEWVRFSQNREFRLVLGWGGKYRKEIELSARKSKVGILPTWNSALKTWLCLHSGMSWPMAWSAVSGPQGWFAFVPVA